MNTYKKINVAFVSVALITVFSVYVYWEKVCVGGGCSYELRNDSLRPLLWSSITLLTISTPFLMLPSHYFKHWLYKIFSWGSFITLVAIADIEAYSSGILSLSRGQMAQGLGIFFVVLSMLFVVYRYRSLKRSGEQKT